MTANTEKLTELHSMLEDARHNIGDAQVEIGFAAEYGLGDGVDAELENLLRELDEVRTRLKSVQVISMHSGNVGDEQ